MDIYLQVNSVKNSTRNMLGIKQLEEKSCFNDTKCPNAKLLYGSDPILGDFS